MPEYLSAAVRRNPSPPSRQIQHVSSPPPSAPPLSTEVPGAPSTTTTGQHTRSAGATCAPRCPAPGIMLSSFLLMAPWLGLAG